MAISLTTSGTSKKEGTGGEQQHQEQRQRQRQNQRQPQRHQSYQQRRPSQQQVIRRSSFSPSNLNTSSGSRNDDSSVRNFDRNIGSEQECKGSVDDDTSFYEDKNDDDKDSNMNESNMLHPLNRPSNCNEGDKNRNIQTNGSRNHANNITNTNNNSNTTGLPSAGPALIVTFASVSLFIALDFCFALIHYHGSIPFPHALMGCMVLFILFFVFGESIVRNIFQPGADCFAKWLPVLFCPILITLPLADHDVQTGQLMRLGAVVVVGFFVTILIIAGSIAFVRCLSTYISSLLSVLVEGEDDNDVDDSKEIEIMTYKSDNTGDDNCDDNEEVSLLKNFKQQLDNSNADHDRIDDDEENQECVTVPQNGIYNDDNSPHHPQRNFPSTEGAIDNAATTSNSTDSNGPPVESPRHKLPKAPLQPSHALEGPASASAPPPPPLLQKTVSNRLRLLMQRRRRKATKLFSSLRRKIQEQRQQQRKMPIPVREFTYFSTELLQRLQRGIIFSGIVTLLIASAAKSTASFSSTTPVPSTATTTSELQPSLLSALSSEEGHLFRLAETVLMLFVTLHNFVIGSRVSPRLQKWLHPLVTCTLMTWLFVVIYAKLFPMPCTFDQVLARYRRVEDHQPPSSVVEFESVEEVHFNMTDNSTLAPTLSLETEVVSQSPSSSPRRRLLEMGAGDILLYLLGPMVISLSVSIYNRRVSMVRHIKEVATAVLVASFGSLFGTAKLVQLINIDPMYRLSMVSRIVTPSLAIAMATMLHADVSIALSAVVVTGLIGASFGTLFLNAFRITDPVIRGLSMGAAAHGLGTGSMVHEENAFPYAASAMALTAFCSTVIVSIPYFQQLLFHVAMGDEGNEEIDRGSALSGGLTGNGENSTAAPVFHAIGGEGDGGL